MVLILPWILSIISAFYCYNHGRFSSLMNLSQINDKEISVEYSTHKGYEEHVYKPKSGVEISKITDGVHIIWEDRQKLTQCISATTITKNSLIHLIHILIKVTSKKNQDIHYKRLDGKYVNITEQEYDLLKSDPSQLTDTSVYFDLTSKTVNDKVFKSVIRYHDGVPTLLVEALPPYKLVAVYDDFRAIWSNKSSSSYVENIIAYFFFTRYYLVMIKVRVNEESKFQNYMYKDGIWNEVEYYTFMNKFLRLKSHIPVTGHLSFDILQLPDDQEYLIEKDEKYGIELSTYYPRRGYVLNSVLKGDHILWESATERCITIIILKKQATIYGLNLALMDDHDERSTLNFVYEDHVYKSVSDEEFKKFNSSLIDPEEFRKFHDEESESHQETGEQQEEEQPEVIIEEPDYAESADTEETIRPEQAQFTGSAGDEERNQQEEEGSDSDLRSKPESGPEQDSSDTTTETHVLDISDFNSRVFLRNSFKLEEVDTYEYLCMSKIYVRSVVDGSMLVWDNSKSMKFLKLYVHHRKELSQLIKLVTKVNTGEVMYFFKRHNANFEPIQNPEYDELFQKMRNSFNLLDNSILLNLSTTPQEKYFDYHNEFDDGVNVLKFITKSLFKLSKITFGQEELWQSLPNEKCTCITRNKFYKNTELIVLNISALTSLSTTKHFKKIDGIFSEINVEAYKLEYNRLKESIPFISNVTLNLKDNLSEANFLYVETVEGNFTHGKYYPKSGYVLNKVSYGSTILWTSTRNRCTQVSLFTGQKSHKLVKISFANNTTPELYYNIMNCKFTKLRNFIEFDFTLKEYNKSDSDGDQCSFCKNQLDRRYTILPDVKKIYLNINVNDPNVYTCFINDLVMSKMFAPKDGYAFSDITDGNAILFRSKSDTNLCVYIHVFYGDKGPRLVKHRTLAMDSGGPGSLYYLEIVDLDVKTLTPEIFTSKLNELSKEMDSLKESQNTKLPLDISVGNPQSVEKTGKFKGLDYKEFKAKDGFFFSKIIFSNDLVYSLDVDEDCSIVRSYFFVDFVVLVELDFVIPGANNSKLYLYRFSNDLITLDIERFQNLLGSMSGLLSKCVELELSEFESTNTYEVDPPEILSDSILKQKTFSSQKKYFTSIKVTDTAVWKANSDLFLAKEVNVYYNEKNPYLIKILLQNLDHDETNMFFEFFRGTWNSINYTEFMNKISKDSSADLQDDMDDVQPIELYDIDITNNINPEYVNYTPGKANGVLFIDASLKTDTCGIRSVSNKGHLMWEASNPDLLCKAALVYYFNNMPQLLKLTFTTLSNVKSHLYKHVSNGYWLEIDEDIFSRKLASFESLSRVAAEPEPVRKLLSKLDTSRIDETLVSVSTTSLNKLTYNQYKPLSGGSFIEVVDNTLIWKSDSNYVCNLARIYHYMDVPVLSKLFLSNDLGSDIYFYYTNANGIWNQITSYEFESSLEFMDKHIVEETNTYASFSATYSSMPPRGMDSPDLDSTDVGTSDSETEQNEVDSQDSDLSDSRNGSEELPEEVDEQAPDSNVKIDINTPNTKYFIVEKGISKNVPFTKIKGKSDGLINEIKDGEFIVWSKTDKYDCTHAKVFSDNGEPKLAELVVKAEKSKMRFLIKVSDGWVPVDEDDFLKQYNSLLDKCSSTLC